MHFPLVTHVLLFVLPWSIVGSELRSYKNPIIGGFAPDPSCTRVLDHFFCVTSSFSAFPGIPVYTSRDLVQWEQVGNVLSRREQLPGLARVNTTTGGVWAPTIRFNRGTYYVSVTMNLDRLALLDPGRFVNAIFKTTDPLGDNWSDPVFFDFTGDDTSLFWDDDGRTYVVGSHYWRIFPAIQAFEIDVETGANLSGGNFTLWNGTGGLAPEGPHLYKKDGFYYLLIAEGTTSIGHMATMARKKATSSGPLGWYGDDPCPFNPVLTAANTTDYLQTVGHADIFDDADGSWWAVALATRNGTVNFPMGRETGLVPVVWEKGQWPVFAGSKPGRMRVNMKGPLPPPSPPLDSPDGGNLVGHSQNVTFGPRSSLPRQLVYYHFPDESAYNISPPGHEGTLALKGAAVNLTEPAWVPGDDTQQTAPFTFVARRQDHVLFTAESTVQFAPNSEGEESGMSVFLNRAQHFDFGIVGLVNGSDSLRRYVRLLTITLNSTDAGAEDPVSKPGMMMLPATLPADASIRLRVKAESSSIYSFSFRVMEPNAHPLSLGGSNANEWTTVGFGDATQVSGGFTGTLVGMYASGNGKPSTREAYFSDLEYIVKEERDLDDK